MGTTCFFISIFFASKYILPDTVLILLAFFYLSICLVCLFHSWVSTFLLGGCTLYRAGFFSALTILNNRHLKEYSQVASFWMCQLRVFTQVCVHVHTPMYTHKQCRNKGMFVLKNLPIYNAKGQGSERTRGHTSGGDTAADYYHHNYGLSLCHGALWSLAQKRTTALALSTGSQGAEEPP